MTLPVQKLAFFDIIDIICILCDKVNHFFNKIISTL